MALQLVTFKAPMELLEQAQQLAQERDQSFSAICREGLRLLVGNDVSINARLQDLESRIIALEAKES